MARIKEHMENLVEKLEQKEELEAEKYKKVDGIILLLRNSIVLAAAVLFMISLILKNHSSILRSIAYFAARGHIFLKYYCLRTVFQEDSASGNVYGILFRAALHTTRHKLSNRPLSVVNGTCISCLR